MEARHTATPWRVLQAKDGSGDFGIGCDIDRAVLAEAYSDIRFHGERSSEGRANAEFIVRACNAHDGLVMALLQVMRPYGMYDIAVSRTDTVMQDELIAVGNRIRAVLAKASA